MKPAAILVDYENMIYYLAGRYRLKHADNYVHAILAQLARPRTISQGNGFEIRPSIRRAYADFERLDLTRPQASLFVMGYAPVYVASTTAKNSADIAIAVDAMHLVTREATFLEHVTIVSGDRDFLPLYQRLEQVGISIDVVGFEEHTSIDVLRGTWSVTPAESFLDGQDARRLREIGREQDALRAAMQDGRESGKDPGQVSSLARHAAAVIVQDWVPRYREPGFGPILDDLRARWPALPDSDIRDAVAELENIGAIQIVQRAKGDRVFAAIVVNFDSDVITEALTQPLERAA